MKIPTTIAFTAAALLGAALLVAPATAQTPFAGDDFEVDVASNAELISRTITPDNSMSVSSFSGFIAPGNFPSSGFDIFGIVGIREQNTQNGESFMPFDLIDGTELDPSEPGADEFDDLGIFRSTDVGHAFVVADLLNNDNESGTGMATWEFDITGRSNIGLSMRMAALGNFEASDQFDFSYSIDGAASQSIFTIRADEDASTTVQLESGNTVTQNGFFDEDLYLALEFVGPYTEDPDGTPMTGDEFMIDYDPDDTDQDGMVEVDFGDGPQTIRSYKITNFDDMGEVDSMFVNPELEELQPIDDPLYVNGDSTNGGTLLTNVLTEFTADIVGTGSTLTLQFDAEQNASNEFFAFDDIVLYEGATTGDLEGDYNDDGEVNAADYTLWRNNLGAGSLPNEDPTASPGVVDAADYAVWRDNYGATAGAGAAVGVVPEPATLSLALLTMIGLVARRRR